MSKTQTIKWSFHAHSILPNVFAGLTAGLVTLVYSISFAALIFSGNLTPFFPQGLSTALIGATIPAIIVACCSQFPFALAGPESNSAIILALMASAIASSVNVAQNPQQLYPTVWLAITLSTVLVGLFLFILGWCRLGQWARFIPYPVIGGFLAGTGWLIVRSSFKVMAGVPLDLTELSYLLKPPQVLHWGVGLLFAITLLVMLNRYRHFFVLPGLLIAGIICFNTVWYLINLFRFNLSADRWFFEPFPNQDLWRFWQLTTFSKVDWGVLVHQSGTLVAMMFIIIISILLNATGLELATSRNVDLNHELRLNGIANLVTGLCGGMVGSLSINRSLLNHRAGADRPLAGILAAGLCASVLLFSSSFLAYLPKSILGGLLLYIGLTLLLRWGYQAWFQFPPSDYALILLILIIIAAFGFLQGVGAGIVISCVLFIFNYGRTPVVKHYLSGATYRSNVQRSSTHENLLRQKGDCIYILVLQGFIFFGTANALLEKVYKRLEDSALPELKYVVFDFRLVSGLDSSGTFSFYKLKQFAQRKQLKLVFTDIQPMIQKQFWQSNLIEAEEATCYIFDDLDQGLEWCETQILETSNLRRNRFVPLAMQLKTFFPDADQVPKLMRYLKSVKLDAGEYLFHQDDPFDGMYFLEFGRLSWVLEFPDGRIKRIRTVTGVNTIGEMGLYQQSPRTASILADQNSSLYFLSTQAFEAIEREEPLLASNFHRLMVKLIAERLQSYEQELSSLLQ